MIISTETEKALEKNSTTQPKALSKLKWEFLNLTKNIYKNPTVNIMLNDEKGDVLPLIKNNARCLLSPFLFTIILEVLANALIQEKEMKRVQIGKEIKLPFFANNIIVYVENPKETTTKNSWN